MTWTFAAACFFTWIGLCLCCALGGALLERRRH